MEKFINKLSEVNSGCVAAVGFKSAGIGELQKYDRKGLLLAPGFAVTTAAYKHFLCYNNLENPLIVTLNDLRTGADVDYVKISKRAKTLIMRAKMPADLAMAIIDAYDYMYDMTEQPVSVSTSFTFEMPFNNADKTNETDLNVQGHGAMLYAVRKCFANVFSVSALQKIDMLKLDISELDVAVCVQKLVRADKSCAGIGITTDPAFASEGVMYLNGSWGLGKRSVDRNDAYDEYWIHKSPAGLSTPLVERKLGRKEDMLIAAADDDYALQTIKKATPPGMQERFVLNVAEVEQLAKCSTLIEDHFKMPMIFTWAKDGENNQIFILTVHPAESKEPSVTASFTGKNSIA